MRPVNANLFEINAAKGRIKAAQAKGENPNAEDLALVETEVLHAFAVAQYSDVMTIEKFARHIATHGCVYSRADISAILYLAVDCMREMLLDGRKIRLGDLGDFSVTLSSKGAESADKFTAANITGVNVWCGTVARNSRICWPMPSSTLWRAVRPRQLCSKPLRTAIRWWILERRIPMPLRVRMNRQTQLNPLSLQVPRAAVRNRMVKKMMTEDWPVENGES